jgi:hypothetical protein
LFIGARDQGIVGFNCCWSGCGVHWRLPFHPMSSEGGGRLSVGSTSGQTLHAVLPKEWPYNGRIGDYMAIASGNPAAQRRGGSPLRFQGMIVTVHPIHGRSNSAACGLCELSGFAVMRLNAFISSAIQLP